MNRWTYDEMLVLAKNGVTKVDLLGHRGTTMVTCEEVAAMAAVIVISGAVSQPNQPIPDQQPPIA